MKKVSLRTEDKKPITVIDFEHKQLFFFWLHLATYGIFLSLPEIEPSSPSITNVES